MKTRQIAAGRRECRVGANRVEFHHVGGGRWLARVYETAKGCWGNQVYKTLRDAKAGAAKTWVWVQLIALTELIYGQVRREDYADFYALYDVARKGSDPVAVALLSDWLQDHDKPDLLRRRILDPGNKAGLVWPAGWRPLAEAAAEIDKASKRNKASKRETP